MSDQDQNLSVKIIVGSDCGSKWGNVVPLGHCMAASSVSSPAADHQTPLQQLASTVLVGTPRVYRGSHFVPGSTISTGNFTSCLHQWRHLLSGATDSSRNPHLLSERSDNHEQTVRSEKPKQTSFMSIASVAQTGFASSTAYDTHRPSYPPEAVDHLIERLEINGQNGVKVLDLAAGTGKFTQLLAARPESYEIVAVEPHDGMRKELGNKKLGNVTVRKGTAENLEGVPDQEFNAVVVAQAFHWMSNMDALKEIHRVLKPTAVLGLIWNIEDYNAPKDWKIHEGWQSTMRDVMHELEDDHPRFRDQQWKKVFDEQGASNPISLHFSDPLFGLPMGEESFDFVRWLSKEDVWKTFNTYSQVANLDSERLSKVEKTFWEAIDSSQTELDDQGRVPVHGKTVVAWTSSIPDVPLKTGG